MNEGRHLGSPNRKKKQTNFMDKILGPVQRRGGSGVFIAMGEQESQDIHSGKRTIYGDSGLEVGSVITYTIDEYIVKIEAELKKEALNDEERSLKTENLLFATNIKVSLRNLDI